VTDVTKARLLSLIMFAALLAIFLADMSPFGMNDGGFW
jgi:hypothetical protein